MKIWRCAWFLVCCMLLHGAAAAKDLRVISLMPSLTETVCALGACHNLVGVDSYSNYPAQVQSLPKLGGLGQYSVEAMLRLKPDLVLLPRSARLAERLQQLGVKTMVLEPENTQQAEAAFLQIGKALGADAAQQKWQTLRAAVQQLAKQVPAAARDKRMYYEVSDAPYAAGEASFIGELFTQLGLQNSVPRSLGAFPKLSAEFVLRAQPDVVMTSENTRSRYARAHPRQCHFSSTERDALVRPGPRMAEAAAAIVACLKRVYP